MKIKITNLTKKLSPAFLSIALTTLSGCYAFFQEKIPMDNTNSNGTLSDLLKKEEKITKLDPPAQVYASKGMYSDRILLSWKESKNATSYRIERAITKPDGNGQYKDPEESDFEIISNYCYSTVYTDKILTNPTYNNEEYSNRYFYRIMAENISEGLESDFTDISQEKTRATGYLLSPPSNVEAWKGKSEDKILLTWNKIPQAAYYKIFRGEKENGTNMEEIDKVHANQNSYTNTILEKEQGTEFYYKVCAETANGSQSAFSSLAMGFSLKYGAPAAPSGLKVENPYAISKTEFNLSWEKAADPAPGIKRTYAIYRTSSEDSVFTLIKKGIELTKTSYTDTNNLKPGFIYYYYIQSIDENETTEEVTKSTFSETGPESEDAALGFLLSPPAKIDIEDGHDPDHVLIKWLPAVGSFVADTSFSYNIYSSDIQSSSFTQEWEVINPEIGLDGYYSYEVEKRNFYKISTININSPDKESDLSDSVAPVPEAPMNVTASKTKNLSSYGADVWKCNTNEVYPILITWEKPEKDNPASYNIYRSTKPDSAFKKINEEPISAQGPLEFIDKNDTAKSGNFYYYKVVSLNSLNQGKKGNNPADDDPNLGTGRNRESWGYGAVTREQWFREYNKEIATSQAKLVLMHKSNDLDKVGSETIYAFIPVKGNIGSLGYNAKVAGLGAEITMPYKQYGDHLIVSNGKLIGLSFILNGNTDTTSNMSANGNMHETVQCYHYEDYVYNPDFTYTFTDANKKNGGSKTYTGEIYDYVNKTSYKIGPNGLSMFQGMYPGYAIYNNLQIKGGAAGGGYYLVQTYELDRTSNSTGTVILAEDKVDWKVGEEIRN